MARGWRRKSWQGTHDGSGPLGLRRQSWEDKVGSLSRVLVGDTHVCLLLKGRESLQGEGEITEQVRYDGLQNSGTQKLDFRHEK